jgi:hypothetical protein
VPGSKLTTARDAVTRFIPDGTSVCLNTGIEALIPFAAGHELIRQQPRDLTLIGPISDILFDQLVGAGCVRASSRRGRQRQRGPRQHSGRWSTRCRRRRGQDHRAAIALALMPQRSTPGIDIQSTDLWTAGVTR